MSSFVISVTNSTGYDLTEEFAGSSYPGFTILSSFGTIVNGTSVEVEIELDSPKDPFYGRWNFSIPSHPFKYYLSVNNPLGNTVDSVSISGSYNSKSSYMSSVNLNGISGCAADRIEIILAPISALITVLS
jgi:hypothetical protein